MPETTIVPVFADQLSVNLSVLAHADRRHDRVLMVEVAEEANHAAHHRKKLAFLFSAMRHPAKALRQACCDLDYVRVADPAHTGSFTNRFSRKEGVEYLLFHTFVHATSVILNPDY